MQSADLNISSAVELSRGHIQSSAAGQLNIAQKETKNNESYSLISS